MDKCKKVKKKARQRNNYSRTAVTVSVRGRGEESGDYVSGYIAIWGVSHWVIARYARGSGWEMRSAIDHGLCAPERANKFSNFCMRLRALNIRPFDRSWITHPQSTDSSTPSYLKLLDPIQSSALRFVMGDFRTSPAMAEAGIPPQTSAD